MLNVVIVGLIATNTLTIRRTDVVNTNSRQDRAQCARASVMLDWLGLLVLVLLIVLVVAILLMRLKCDRVTIPCITTRDG